MQNKKCVFFDRDGVINKRIIDSYVTKQSEFEINVNILPILKFCDDNNLFKIIITNQQGIGKSIMSEMDLESVHNFMNNILLENQISTFDDIYFASELKGTEPFRRKPSPKMLLEAIKKYDLQKQDCILIGDSKSDIDSAVNANIKSIFYSISEYDEANFSSQKTEEILNFLTIDFI